jgi:molybdopterin converting factor small subunit
MSTTSTTHTTLQIPTPLRSFTGGNDTVTVTGDTAGAAIANLVEQYPDLKQHLYADDGTLRSFVNIYVNDDDIRYLEGPDTRIGPDDALSIVPAVAGG